MGIFREIKAFWLLRVGYFDILFSCFCLGGYDIGIDLKLFLFWISMHNSIFRFFMTYVTAVCRIANEKYSITQKAISFCKVLRTMKLSL